MIDVLVRDKLEQLERWFVKRGCTITAFSGGIDSSLVLFLSHHFLGDDALGCISDSPSLKRRDLALAKDFCERHGIPLRVINTDEITDEDYLSNPSNRCFFCKNHLYLSLREMKKEFPDHVLLNGTNADDLGDYRPGLQAAADHKIESPLVDVAIDKAMVRQIAKYFGIEHWDKPASPCLSSRVPYGHRIDRSKLAQVEAAENVLFKYGFSDVRVRHYENEARIEVPAHELARLQHRFISIAAEIERLGFEHCTIDGEGLVSGKLNRALL